MEHLEGRISVLAALRAFRRTFRVILIRAGAHPARTHEVVELARTRNVPVRFAEPRELDAIAHGGSHGGIVAICSPKPRATDDEILELVANHGGTPVLLLLEGIDDARNLGFTLRSADALGADAVLIKKHVWDFDPIEVARPSGGAYERLPLAQIEGLELLKALQRRGLRLNGCVAGAKTTIYQRDLAGPLILAIGGEKRGLSGAVRAICDRFMSIPAARGASSLALSHAAAIVMAETLRQRTARDRAQDAVGSDDAHDGLVTQ